MLKILTISVTGPDALEFLQRAAVVMMHIYRRLLDALLRRGWRRYAEPVKIGKRMKIWIALRYGLI